MNVEGKWRRAIEPIDGGARILDQSKLPFAVAWLDLLDTGAVARAIRDMNVRGAPLIGATAAYGVAIAMRTDPSDAGLAHACTVLAATRPTAINLKWALDDMRARLAPIAPSGRADAGFAAAAQICTDEVARSEAIGEHGFALLDTGRRERPLQILTHCNAGWLATVDWGTALAPIYKAFAARMPIHVWVDETRPRNQGLLTAWELRQQGVPHTLIPDNAGGHLMQQGKVDMCIVGTDRTTRNGDVCNKIGTYLKALAAHDNNVPFYAAVPSTSIDWTVGEPGEIPIEERGADEVRVVHGSGGSVKISDGPVANPAFDVTPRRFVTGLITERGVATPSELQKLFGT